MRGAVLRTHRPLRRRGSGARVREDLGLPAHVPYLLSVANFQPRKNLVRLIKAAARLPEVSRGDLALAGIVLGIVFSLGARSALAHRFPLLQVVVDGGWIIRATVIGIAGALLGALYPAFKAAQKDPIDALAYE